MSLASARGYSLVEVIVASVLGLILLQLFVMVLVPMGRAAARGADQVELRQMAAAALDKVAADVDRTSSDGLSVTPRMLAVQPLAGVTADGAAAWTPELIVYGAVSGKLLRRAWPPGPPALSWTPRSNHPAHATLAEMGRILEEPTGRTVLASWVKSFSATAEGGTVRLHLEVEREKERYALDVCQFLRNP